MQFNYSFNTFPSTDEDNISLPSMDSDTMRELVGRDEDSHLLPDDIPSDDEFGDYEFGKELMCCQD